MMMKKMKKKSCKMNHMSDEVAHKLLEQIGYITAKVEGLDGKIDTQIKEHEELQIKVARHEVVLGKFGAGLAIAIFAISFFGSTIIGWARGNFQ